MNSSGDITKWVVPSRQGVFSFSTTWPAALVCTHSEFLYCDDMADACVFLMNLPDERYAALLGSDECVSGRFEPPLVNIGVGADVTIAALAEMVKQATGYQGAIVYDSSKPDGTPRKLMDVRRINEAGWKASTGLETGLANAYAAFVDSMH